MATSTQIVWTFIFEVLFLHETLDLWSIAGTALILGYMMILGIIKVIESSKHLDTDIEESIDEEGVLLEPQKLKNGYGATALEWQGSNSF